MNKFAKLISVILATIICISACIIPSFAEDERLVDKSGFATDYPYIFVHGMGGWAPENEF